MAKKTPAREALRRFMKRESLLNIQVARAVGVSKALVSGWLSGTALPGALFRLKLERWTNGEVAALDWLTSKELQELEATTPFAKAAA